ncbi:hypothetical protein CDL15_Pgr000953 [Punica granatum]|uniref:Uncharacterized protein n=1 Tax=Punica granatum TaxID=22663 RepID=A0A218XHV4_PUNGR|nr:hypothetical protein CDL15_Pgr000953 [Punica granatum]
MAWSFCRMHGFSATGTVLRKNGGSRLKGVNFLKPAGFFSRPKRQSNYAPYPYFELLSNLCSYYRSWDTTHRYLEANVICNACAGNKGA